MSPFSKIMTHEEGLAASNPISRLGAGHQHLGEGGGLRAEPSPGTWSVLSLPFPRPDLVFFAFKLFCRVTLEQKNPPPKKKIERLCCVSPSDS